MLKTYPAIFHQETNDHYWIEFPNFGGGTASIGIEESMKHAHDMLESVLATYIDQGMELPEPTEISTLKVDHGFATLIQVDPTPFLKSTKALRKNVTVPEWLVRLADRQKINYSETLTKALEDLLFP
ncbi:type II toxin-antitoxin system HicB family antitoxin [Streptococcus uberis]|uniref:type II toxin-antitoxin system HicB family antitoxin n=1 Tax=Streptococcus uberis TaxID=1349 RepID=UPI0021503400|nr:type II toxin-antitoxin system HicB family antitoxin [Streptococcus uberis]MCR4257327.1 type II toxin-antitoxin system HicB family antitoxin [Streptococcus uberis]